MKDAALKETLKTVARGVWFGLLGVVVLVLTVIVGSPEVAQATVNVPVLNFDMSVGTIIIAGAAALAKTIDRYIHKSRNTDLQGLAPSFLQR